MKLGIFTDSHYSSQEITCGKRYNSRSFAKIQAAYRRFLTEGCELVLCLGDLIDRETSHAREIENLGQVAEVIRASGLPTVCLMGNHDAFAFTEEAFYALLGGCRPQDMTVAGKRLLFLDACYRQDGGHYKPGDTDWTDTCYPHTAALKERLQAAPGEVYLFMHQNIDPAIPANHRLHNDAEVRAIIEASGNVRAVYQGHYHAGKSGTHNGIAYVTFPAMCEREDAFFIVDI